MFVLCCVVKFPLIRVVRAYPLIEIRPTAPCRAVRGNSISVNSTLPPLLSLASRWGQDKRAFRRSATNPLHVAVVCFKCAHVAANTIHPVSITRFPSFRTQTLDNLSHYLWKNRFLSNPAPGENLVSGNLVMETGCKCCHMLLL